MRGLLLAAALAAVIAGAGLAALYASSYLDVGELSGVKRSVRVVVSGETVNMGLGKGVLVFGNETYGLELRGLYGLAKRSDGTYAYGVFLLEGGRGFRVVVLYDAEALKALYGLNIVVEDRIVVDGVYDPQARALIYHDGREYSYPVIIADKILAGCKRAYAQEPVERS